jgi:hypothetical protein
MSAETHFRKGCGLADFGKGEGLDPGIRHYVLILRKGGVETCQSCQGGPGHAYLEPTVDFLGGKGEGPRAFGVALSYGLPVSELRRVWSAHQDELDGPIWQMTFRIKADTFLKRDAAHSAAYFKSRKTGRIHK